MSFVLIFLQLYGKITVATSQGPEKRMFAYPTFLPTESNFLLEDPFILKKV